MMGGVVVKGHLEFSRKIIQIAIPVPYARNKELSYYGAYQLDTHNVDSIHIMCKLPYFCIFKFLNNKRILVRWNSVEGDLGGSDEEEEKTSSGKAWDCGDCSLEA